LILKPRQKPNSMSPIKPRLSASGTWLQTAAKLADMAAPHEPWSRFGLRAFTTAAHGGSEYQSGRANHAPDALGLRPPDRPCTGATMSDDEKTVRRILHFKFTLPSADSAQLLSILKTSKPYSTIFGEVNVRFLQNADDRAKILQIVEYDAPKSIEANRQSLASDPRVQAYLQVWRSMAPNVEMDVYQELEG
jgi:hypothetical protein